MNYATTYHIGNNQNSRTAKAKTIAPSIGRVCQVDGHRQRRQRSAERQTEIRTDSHVTNGILKCTFLPKLKDTKTVQDCRKTTEREFYHSLSIVTKRYGIEPMQTQHLGYPYNVAMALWDVQTKLKRTDKTLDTVYLAQSPDKTFLATPRQFNTDTTLYYVPIVPLYRMLQDRQRKRTAYLLISVCSYLYRVAQVPYYRKGNSYMFGQYETHKEWILSDMDEDEKEIYRSDLEIADKAGDHIEPKLRNRNNLRLFEQRLNNFKSRDTFDQECWQMACKAFALYSDYPTTTIFQDSHVVQTDPYHDETYNDTIKMSQYISFVADIEGCLFENIKEGINSEFNECGALEEPILYEPMDGSRIAENNFDFEERFFDLLNEVCGLLSDYQTTAS